MANDIPANLTTIRTTEDIVNALSTLYFNLNEIERVYYDMFINPIPMDITLQRYNDVGTLETITVPNRAKDTQNILIGSGSPNGVVAASVGTHYLDTAAYNLYIKTSGSDSSGWILLWSSLNLIQGVNFLAPNGDASRLTNLNMNNAGSGILAVGRGGTGANNITGVIKGNGEAPFSAAVDGVDYMGPNSMVGIVAYFTSSTILSGWLRCDGAYYSPVTYSRLYNKIGYTFGRREADGYFAVPDLMDMYIRGWDGSSPVGTLVQDQVGKHKHELTGNTDEENSHTHTAGNLGHNHTLTLYFQHGADGRTQRTKSGRVPPYWGGGDVFDAFDAGTNVATTSTATSWSGATSGGSAHSHTLSGSTDFNTDQERNEVRSRMLVPVIKY